MTKEEFIEKVYEAIREPMYAVHRPDKYIRESIAFYDDIIDDAMEQIEERGIEYAIDYAARNISMCI